jgi:YihY family inner membrane protein
VARTVSPPAQSRTGSLPARGNLRSALKAVSGAIVETFRGFRADRGADLAASLAFATLLTAVPLLATFALFLATFFKENVTAIFDLVNMILPYHTAQVTESLRAFISQSSAITGVGLALLFVASLRLLFIVEGIVNTVWGAPRRRALVPRILLYTVGLFALALLVGSIALGVRFLKRFAAANEILSMPATDFFYPFAVEFAALTLLYKYLPNADVRWTSAAAGGGAVAGSLEVLRLIFGLYVKGLSSINLITGSLTLVLLTLLSVYFGWVLILLGVELVHAIQTQASRRRTAGGPRAGAAENAIRMLLQLARGGTHGLRELHAQQGESSPEAERILTRLQEAGLVSGDPAQGFWLARPARRITVAQVVDALTPNLYTVTPAEGDRVIEILGPLFERLHAERRALLGMTLADFLKRRT